MCRFSAAVLLLEVGGGRRWACVGTLHGCDRLQSVAGVLLVRMGSRTWVVCTHSRRVLSSAL